MSLKDYKMGFQVPVPMARWHHFRAGIMTPWEIALLFQDMLERQCVPTARIDTAVYFITIGHCHVEGRALQ
jgi:hypothetical protein